MSNASPSSSKMATTVSIGAAFLAAAGYGAFGLARIETYSEPQNASYRGASSKTRPESGGRVDRSCSKAIVHYSLATVVGLLGGMTGLTTAFCMVRGRRPPATPRNLYDNVSRMFRGRVTGEDERTKEDAKTHPTSGGASVGR